MMRLRSTLGFSFTPFGPGQVTGATPCPPGYTHLPFGASPNSICPGQTPQLSADGQCYKCGSGAIPTITTVTQPTPDGGGAELTHGPNAGANTYGGPYTNVTHDAAPVQGNCPSSWFVMDPSNTNPCGPGLYPQTYSPDGYTRCGRCQLAAGPAAPFACPSGWTDQPISCNPGEQPLELIHRNADGTLAACYQCRQTMLSVMYQQKLIQSQQQGTAAPTPPPVAPKQTTNSSGPMSTGTKIAVVAGALVVAGLILKSMSKKSGGGRSRSTRQEISDDED